MSESKWEGPISYFEVKVADNQVELYFEDGEPVAQMDPDEAYGLAKLLTDAANAILHPHPPEIEL